MVVPDPEIPKSDSRGPSRCITLHICSDYPTPQGAFPCSIATLPSQVTAPRGQAARQRIIESTRDLILDGGLAAFNVEAVADASGSARSTVYRHWPEPRDLVIETLTSMVGEIPTPDTGALSSDLEAVAAIMLSIFDDPKLRRLVLDITTAAAEDPELERIRQRQIKDRQQPVQLILQRAIARGEMDPELDLNIAIHLVEGPMLSAVLLENRQMSDEAIETMVDRIVRSLS